MHEAEADEASDVPASVLRSVANAMAWLHKEQFGRGATKARAHFAGPDTLVCVLSDVLLPAERKMVEMGLAERVTDSRTTFESATRRDFVETIERIVDRKVTAFASCVDPAANVAFEIFVFESPDADAVSSGDTSET
jgi:uncharacterized protein YbcI